MKITNRILLALLLFTTSLFAQTNLKSGLVACYPFNANARDESGNGNNGTVNGAVLTTDRFGKVNSCYDFNGNSYITLPSNKFGFANYSYSLWIYVSSLPSNGDTYRAFSVGGNCGDQNIDISNDYYGITGIDGGGYDISSTPSVSGTSTGVLPTIGKWYHVVTTRSNSEVKLYIDGSLLSTVSTSGKLPYYGCSGEVLANIGTRSNVSQFFQGKVDDIHIYNRALNAAEVKALYEGNSAATITINTDKIAPCGGDNVTFTATGASSTAQYQWKVDGVNIGTNSKTFTYNSANKTVDYQVKVSVEVKDEEVCFPQKPVTVESTVTIKNCTPPPTAVDLKSGLVACYPFNANANDATGNGNNGTVNGATLTTDRFGKLNSAYNFNGSSLISINPAQFKNQSYTYATWVKLDNLPSSGDNNCLITIGGNGGDQVLSVTTSYQVASSNGFNIGGYNNGSPLQSNNWTGVSPALNRWYHVVCTRDDTSIKLYVDGQLIGNNSTLTSTIGTTPNYGSPTYVTFGARNGGASQYMQGSLDDIYIYNRAITAQEVSALYEVTKSPTAVDLKTGLLACYPFNGNANDAFGNDNNGTVSGATLTNDRFGIPNSAYNFDGNSFIKLGNPNDFKNNTFTYAAWVKVPVAPDYNSLSAYSIVSIGSGQVLSLINRPAEGLFWGFTTYSDENISYDINPSSNLKTDINTWHHVVISRSPTQAKLYVDGTQIMTATTPVPTTATYTSSNPSVVYQAAIGTRPDETNIQFFKGIIDDVHIYNRPLDAAEIRALYDGNTSSTITITSDKVAPCGGDNITFTANGASSTTQYRWKVDGVNVGTNSKFFVYNSSVKSTDYQVKVSVEVTGEECFPDGIATVENTVTIKNCNPCVDGVVACHPFTVVKTK